MNAWLLALADEGTAWIEGLFRFLPGRVGSGLRIWLLRRRGATIGRGCHFSVGSRVLHPSGLTLGDRVQVNDATINARGGVVIGDDCMLADGAKIWTINHRYDSTSQPMATQGFRLAPVVLANDVWVATNAVVLPGVRVGQGAIVAAGSVAMRNVPEYSIVAGVPASVVRRRGGSASTSDDVDAAALGDRAPDA